MHDLKGITPCKEGVLECSGRGVSLHSYFTKVTTIKSTKKMKELKLKIIMQREK